MHAACRLQHKREQVMANLKGTNPANSGDGKALAVEAKVHRLDRNDLVALQASYRNMQAQVGQAQKDVDFNMVNFHRQEQLIADNFTPKATYDAARNTLQGSQQKLASLQQQLAGLAANLNGNPDAPIENHPKYKDAVAARDEAKRQLAHTVVRAPFAGIVTNVPSLQPGQYLAAAAVAFKSFRPITSGFKRARRRPN